MKFVVDTAAFDDLENVFDIDSLERLFTNAASTLNLFQRFQADCKLIYFRNPEERRKKSISLLVFGFCFPYFVPQHSY